MKVIFDTDIGNDIDDTLALTYLLCQPECELLGVTTTTGLPVQRAKLADSVIKYFGKDIPVYPGVENPILTPQKQPLCPQEAVLEHCVHSRAFRMNYAVEFIREMTEQYPGEITLISVGPATNLGVLFAAYPNAASGLRAVSQMIGYYKFNAPLIRGYSEWNCYCDPIAAQICFQAPIDSYRLFGLDVTMKLILSEQETRERFTSRSFGPVNMYRDFWFRRQADRPGMIFHDPLAAACVFDESICGYVRGGVAVDLKSDIFYAATLMKEGEGSHEAAVSVDVERFFTHFFDVVNGAG
ncbi:MAG: nucleoside hydrolase [Clostridiales bacterium]|nr:nucleoside hydrolase [Clostridiales bacterium]